MDILTIRKKLSVVKIILILLLSLSFQEINCEKCVTGALSAHKQLCNSYYLCNNGVQLERSCPSGLEFNSKINTCDWPQNVKCQQNLVSFNDVATTEKEALEEAVEEAAEVDAPEEGIDTTTIKPITQKPIYSECPKVDQSYPVHIQHPDCTKFYKCFKGIAYEHNCPWGLAWSTKNDWCDYPTIANCTNNSVAPQPSVVVPSPPSTEKPSLGSSVSPPSSPHNYTTCPKIDPSYPVHIPHPNCNKFYKCLNGQAYEISCPAGQHWSIKHDWCDYPQNANCTENNVIAQPSPPSTNNSTNGGNSSSSPITTEKPTFELSNCPKIDTSYPVHIPHPNCNKFYKCMNGQAYEISCPAGQHWSTKHDWCDFPENANCTENNVIAQPSPPSTNNSTNGGNSSSSPITTQKPTIEQYTNCPKIDPSYPVHIPHPNCNKFYKCMNGQAYEISCPAGQHWSIKHDWCDFPENSNCTENNVIAQPSPPSTNNSTNGGNSTSPITTQKPAIEIYTNCPSVNGKYVVHLAHPNCKKFYKCSHGKPIEMDCPSGQHWSIQNDWCDFPENANCTEGLANIQ